MKAIVWTKYGSAEGLQLREVAKPTPKDNEVLIKVHAATAATPDTELRRLKLPLIFAIPLRLYLGLIKPTRITILGTEFAGEIISVGKEVTRYQPGDQVFGYTGLGLGAYAEDRKSTRLNSSHTVISYAVFCLKKKKIKYILYLFKKIKKTRIRKKNT